MTNKNVMIMSEQSEIVVVLSIYFYTCIITISKFVISTLRLYAVYYTG